MDLTHQIHLIPPVFDENSRILILGSFPSIKSREVNFFYGHPQNRFWRVISHLLNENCPKTAIEKKHMLLKHKIALWDVIASCDIKGSSDSSITNVVPNDIGKILVQTKIKNIFVNGKTADRLYIKYIEPDINIKAVCLPSTSPANAMWSLEKLIDKWCIITQFCEV